MSVKDQGIIKNSNRILKIPSGKESAANAGSIPGWEDILEKGMTIHSSILAWKIPWTEELSGLWSIGLQGVRHN